MEIEPENFFPRFIGAVGEASVRGAGFWTAKNCDESGGVRGAAAMNSAVR